METILVQENNQPHPNRLNSIIFYLSIVLSFLSVVLMVGEVRYLISSNNSKSSTTPNATQNISSNTAAPSNSKFTECNTDLTTWKSTTYTTGNIPISFKYPSCWQLNTDERFDKYAPKWHYINSGIDLSYSDPNLSYKGPRAETEENKLSSLTIGRGSFSLTSPATSKEVGQAKIAGYPATKTIYKGSKGDVSIEMFSDTGIVVKVPDQIELGRIGIAFTIQYYETDKTDYSKIADLIGSTFEIKQ